MDQERNPGDSEPEFKRAAELSNERQPDPQLVEGPVGRGRIATYVVVILLILGAVIYGLNTYRPSNQQPAQTTQSQTTTTGSATNRPAPPQSAPTGSDIDRASQPPFAGQSK